MNQKLLLFYNFLRKDTDFVISNAHTEALKALKTDFINAANVTLRLPKPGLHYVLLGDATCHGTCFVLTIEDYLVDQKGQPKESYAPVSFGSRLFNDSNLVYYREVLALYFALDHFAQFLWGASKPILVLTDNRNLPQLFQSKSIHLSLWNCLDRVLFFKFLIAHMPGEANSAADFLSRMQTDPSLCLSIKLTDRVPFCEIEVETEAKTPDVPLSNIDKLEPF